MTSPRSTLRFPSLLSLALVAGGACGEPQPETSLVLISLDTTRADRLGSYGFPDAGTPHMDALARRGVTFDRAYTPVPITLPAHTSLLTGLLPPEHGVRDNVFFRADEELTTLAEVLTSAGFRTGGFIGGLPLHRRFGLAQGFETYDDDLASRPPMPERSAEDAVSALVAWLDTVRGDERFFAFLHLFDAHLPYNPPPRFAERFAEDLYQAEIAAMDAALGELFAALEARSRLDQTFIILTGDHGESLGEHLENTHGFLIYDSTTRVPLILAGPGVPGEANGLHVATPVRLIDVAPTALELLGVPARLPGMGCSLAELWSGAEHSLRPVYLESLYARYHRGWSELHGLVSGPWRYIEAPSHPPELYHLLDDPAEELDRAALEPEITRALGAELRELRERMPSAQNRSLDFTTEEELAKLELLGYSGDDPSDASQADKHPREMMRLIQETGEVRGLLQAGRHAEALAALERLEEVYGPEAGIHRMRGNCYRALARTDASQLEDAIASFRSALELRPRHIYDNCDLARLLVQAGRLEEALESAQTALQLDGEDIAARGIYAAVLDALIADLSASAKNEPLGPVKAQRLEELRARRREFTTSK